MGAPLICLFANLGSEAPHVGHDVVPVVESLRTDRLARLGRVDHLVVA